MIQDKTATLVSRESVADEYFIVLRFKTEAEFSFQAGQFVMLQIPAEPRAAWRCYSIASSPRLAGEFELVVRVVPGGVGSTFLADLKVGDSVTFRGPAGKMTLDDSADPLLLVGAGSGCAPLLAMIHEEFARGWPRPVTAAFGYRAPEMAVHAEFLTQLAESSDGRFRVSFCTDQAEKMDSPHFFSGRVTELLRGWNDSNARVYLCGLPMMIDDMAALLKENGVPAERIHSEKF